ncbi:MAG: PilZ domain-containing protein [Fimbriimonadaceae bacterium]|nr:PilZ domain-containing protein [Fimbriimonadaceae bacterium]
MKRTKTDRREYSRFEILEYALMQREGDEEPQTCVVVDVSLGGLQVRTRSIFVAGEVATITIGRGGVRPVASRVEVRYVYQTEESDLYSVGLRFLPGEAKERMAMVDFIHDVFRQQGDRLFL